jgi:hypothetical protein
MKSVLLNIAGRFLGLAIGLAGTLLGLAIGISAGTVTGAVVGFLVSATAVGQGFFVSAAFDGRARRANDRGREPRIEPRLVDFPHPASLGQEVDNERDRAIEMEQLDRERSSL